MNSPMLPVIDRLFIGITVAHRRHVIGNLPTVKWSGGTAAPDLINTKKAAAVAAATPGNASERKEKIKRAARTSFSNFRQR
ncbi:hypothetical protein MTP99_009824 [Tenebrio molitor]|jgi:hypothetical protein|nr:hypothetical protein MTP99_009824 [Tenebrio molitor]